MECLFEASLLANIARYCPRLPQGLIVSSPRIMHRETNINPFHDPVDKLSLSSLDCAASTSADLRMVSNLQQQLGTGQKHNTYSLSSKPITCATLAFLKSGGTLNDPLVSAGLVSDISLACSTRLFASSRAYTPVS